MSRLTHAAIPAGLYARLLATVLLTCLPALQSARAAASILDREVVFNLPPQQVENALLGFSEQAHVQILTASAVIPDRQSAEVSGRMRIRAALESILRDTGLGYSMVNDDTIAIQAAGKNLGGANSIPGNLPTGSPVVRTSNSAPIRLAQAETRPESARDSTAGATRPSESAAVEEVIVTANKRSEETAQSLPLSISALSGQHLRDAGATEFSDWSHSVPGLVFQDQGPGDKRYIIRGVQSTGAATVGVYLDNAVISGSNGEDDGGGKNIDIRLYDVDRIEVLRGPQGTLYGAGSLSGTIRLLTNQPKLDRLEGDAGVEVSDTLHTSSPNYNYNGMINLPLIQDRLALRAVGWSVTEAGYIDNVRLGIRGVNNEKTQGGRATLAFAATDRLRITGSILYQDQFVGGKSFFFPSDGDLKESEYTRDPRTDRATISQFEVNYRTDVGSFDVSSAYFDRFVYFRFDSTPILIFFGVPDLPAVTLQPERSSIWTNEARFSSNLSGPFNFVVGALHERLTRSFISSVVTVDAQGNTDLTADEPNVFGRTSAKQVQQEAVFGEGTYTFTPHLSVTGGLRWFRSEEHANSQNTYPFFGGPPEAPRFSHQSEDKVTPKLSVNYKFNDDLLLYALAAEGFRQGGTNDGGFGSLIEVPEGFKSDSLWNYEIGMKSAWLERRLLLNLTAYAIRWSDIQTQNETTLGFVYIGNAGTAESNGLEAELTMRPTRHLELQASLSVQDAHLTQDQPLAATSNEAGLSGDRIPNTPRVTANGSAQYTIPLTGGLDGVLRGEVSYVGNSQTYFDRRSIYFQTLAPYALADFRVGLQANSWNATLFVRNAFDKRAEVDKLYQEDSPLSVFTARPRTVGINLNYRF
ncbi:MAG TPA: TonB-dependent receptor [Steroidobacteraceae bacterium]|nr:TonB-dependent receptor [Steroidobacteraceae bacterium]